MNNTPNPWQYAKDWHHCVDCGCLWPDRCLQPITREDKVLNITEKVLFCRDRKACARFKKLRDAHLAAEQRRKAS